VTVNAAWVLFFLGLAFRIVGAALGGVNSDDGDHTYEAYARALLSGRGLVLNGDFGPVYSFLPPGMGFVNLPFIYFFGAHWMGAERIFILIMSSVANVALVRVAKRLVGDPAAWIAGFLWALYPAQWFWSTRVNAQPVATNLVVFSLLLLFQSWEKKSSWRAVVVGILLAAASLCRGEYTLGVFVLSAVTLFAGANSSAPLKISASLVIGWLVVFSRWVIRNYKIHHRFVLVATNDGYNIWKAYNPEYNFSGVDIPLPPDVSERLAKIPNEADRAKALKSEAFAYMKTHPGRTIYLIVGNALNFWRPWLAPSAASLKQNFVYVVSWLPVFCLFLMGLWHLPWREPTWLAVVGLLSYKWAIHIFFYVIVRYREAAFPLIALIAMIPVDRWFRDREVNYA
jgi:4-amino-4-deoxy-L-arabinose transferase-like glycosyltransferase